VVKNYYKKYYESHKEQEKARTLVYYKEHREEILARNKEKRAGMPKIKKPTLREKLLLTETAYKMACQWIDAMSWSDNDCDTPDTVEYFMQKAREYLKNE
jgi:hypothetical protein